MRNYAYLVMVNEFANNNKFYEITENDNNSLDVRYGRIGGTEIKKHYERYEKDFWTLKREKEHKGYEDRTALHSEVAREDKVSEELSYKPVEDESTQELLELLINSSREFMKKNYTVSATEITEKMVNEAQYDLDELNRIASNLHNPNVLYRFNETLKTLFTDIPRKMTKVADHLAHSEADFTRILEREQEMLDNVKGAIVHSKTQNTSIEKKDCTVLEAFGLKISPVTYKQEDEIVAHLGLDYNHKPVENRYVRSFAVENIQTRNNYEQYKKDHNMTNKDVRLFYHGSKVENFYSIIKQGLSLNPNASVTGKMFGQGLYFAPECRKSLNYMDVKGSCWNNGQRNTGYCAIFSVALGKCYQPSYILGSSFKGEDLPVGCSSVFANKRIPSLNLKNDEYIVYNQNACTIKYLMEMKDSNTRDKTYHLDRKVLRNCLEEGFDVLVRTPDGVMGNLNIEKLPLQAKEEINNKIISGYDATALFIDYNIKSDRITLEAIISDEEHITIAPDITIDDYAFLSREMKKAFAESEPEWKSLMETAKEYPSGKNFMNKNGVLPNPKKSRQNDMQKEVC